MNDIFLEAMDLIFLFFLNPVAWVVIILVTVRNMKYWKVAFSGITTQLVSTIILLSFIFVGDGIDMSELLQDVSTGDIVLLIFVPVVSGLVMSALVALFVKQRRLQQLA